MPDPVDIFTRATMTALAEGIDGVLNGEEGRRRFAFILLVAEFGKVEGGRVNYVSNGERADALTLLREYLARAEGRVGDAAGREQ